MSPVCNEAARSEKASAKDIATSTGPVRCRCAVGEFFCGAVLLLPSGGRRCAGGHTRWVRGQVRSACAHARSACAHNCRRESIRDSTSLE